MLLSRDSCKPEENENNVETIRYAKLSFIERNLAV